jgi:hypothetical protein
MERPLGQRFIPGTAAYPYEYFCGANTVLYFNGTPALEIAGLSFTIVEGKRPLYGYSSRFFDGVARGNVIVEGSLLVNMVDSAYLVGLLDGVVPTTPQGRSALATGLSPDLSWDDLEDTPTVGVRDLVSYRGNPHDRGVGFYIKVVMGAQDGSGNRLLGNSSAGFSLTGLTFTGRGSSIQVDEQVIVEQHMFLARNFVPN